MTNPLTPACAASYATIPLLTVSPATLALFEAWMTQALTMASVSVQSLSQGQVALVTLLPHGIDDRAQGADQQAQVKRVDCSNSTTCTLRWQQGHWQLCSLSNLSQIPEQSPPCTEYVFWLGHTAKAYRLQWAPLSPEEANAALQAWERWLHHALPLTVHVSFAIDQQEHDITLTD